MSPRSLDGLTKLDEVVIECAENHQQQFVGRCAKFADSHGNAHWMFMTNRAWLGDLVGSERHARVTLHCKVCGANVPVIAKRLEPVLEKWRAATGQDIIPLAVVAASISRTE